MKAISKKRSSTKRRVTRVSMEEIEASVKKRPLMPGERSSKQLAGQPDSAIDFSDIPELDKDFFRLAEMLTPHRKRSMTIRIDGDVYDWLKMFGSGYQSRVNAMLKAMMIRHGQISS